MDFAQLARLKDLAAEEVLGQLLHEVNGKAALGVAPEAIDLVVRRGHGSSRDALSVLDQVAAAGEVFEGAVVNHVDLARVDRDCMRQLPAAVFRVHDDRVDGVVLASPGLPGYRWTTLRPPDQAAAIASTPPPTRSATPPATSPTLAARPGPEDPGRRPGNNAPGQHRGFASGDHTVNRR